MKTSLTEKEYLTLHGVLTLAASHKRSLENLEVLAAEIIGEEYNFGYDNVSDAIWSDSGADELLRRLDITIEKETPTP